MDKALRPGLLGVKAQQNRAKQKKGLAIWHLGASGVRKVFRVDL
jgi:hypothetical protein